MSGRGLVVVGAGAVMTCADGDAGLGLRERAAVVVDGDRVAWVGPEDALPTAAQDLPRVDAAGGLVTPGLVDAHAHPIFGGARANEFALRARGATYLEIAAAGGGIKSTVAATRAASDDALLASARARLTRALRAGTTTMEAKTGYALTVDGELRLLGLYARLASPDLPALVPTLLGAHVVPPEYADDRAGWVAACAGPMLAGARGLAHAVDVYCDEGAFTLEETRQILGAASAAGFEVRAHAGQFADLGAAGLVARLGGLSADHLEAIDEEQAAAMAVEGTVATLLAGACVQLRRPVPPVAMMRAAGCAFALGTDLNPGSSHSESLPLQMWIATTHLGLTVEEAWLGVTRVGARAAGRRTAGRLVPGAPADLVIWDVADYATVPYHYGADHVHTVIRAGVTVRAG